MSEILPYRVTLRGQHTGIEVVFNTMPALYEDSTVQYSPLSPQHLIGDYQIFEHTVSRHFNFGEIKLVSRNSKEARENLDRINTLKGWTKPYFGSTSHYNNTPEEQEELTNWLGAPPEVVLFSALLNKSERGVFKNIPTVITKVGINYPNDCDYIPTAYYEDEDNLGGIPFPIICTLSLDLVEQHAPSEYEKFNLAQYRKGQLESF